MPVAQRDQYKGLWSATFDAAAPPLRDYLGEMAWYLDAFFDRREGCIEVIGGVHKWLIPCNWKFPAENFGGDGYHTSWSHLSAIRTGVRRRLPRPAGFRRRHAIARQQPLRDRGRPRYDGRYSGARVGAYEAEILPELERRLGPRIGIVKPLVGTMFPNFSMLRPTSRTIRVWHPRPTRPEVWAWAYADKAAPREVKEAIRLAGARVFGPSGTFEQDDMDNWQRCTQTGRGVIARRYDLTYEMGLGHEYFDNDLGAWASEYRYSELNHRSFYRRWAELMAADCWATLASGAAPEARRS